MTLSRPPRSRANWTSCTQASADEAAFASVCAIVSSSTRSDPVAAEEQAVAVLEREEIDVDIHVLFGATERVRENVAHVRRGDVARLEPPPVDEHLSDRVILGEAMEAARPEQIGARVSDVNDQQVRPRLRAAVSVDPMPSRAESSRPFLKITDPTCCTMSRARRSSSADAASESMLQDPVRDVQREADERADREPARHFAAGVTAHPVGDDQHVVDLFDPFGHLAGREARERRLERARHLRHEELVLVVLAKVPCVRQGAHIDADQR